MIEIRDFRIDILVISDTKGTEWPNNIIFFEPLNVEEAFALKNWCHALSDGDIVRVRGRDSISVSEENTVIYEDWENGYALKMGNRFFLLWNKEVESLLIDGCNFLEQLHFQCTPSGCNLSLEDFRDKRTKISTIVLCHGFCEEDGPNYQLILILKNTLVAAGHHVIVPDFRPSYKYGSGRARSERVRIILESILIDMSQNLHRFPTHERPGYILIGHSQGGAAISQLCESSSLVAGVNIMGLILLGSESPTEQLQSPHAMYWNDDVQDSTPPIIIHSRCPGDIPPRAILCVHSEHDAVIHHMQIEDLARRWECKFIRLTSEAKPTHDHVEWAADIQHDFLAKDLIMQVLYYVHRHIDEIEQEVMG